MKAEKSLAFSRLSLRKLAIFPKERIVILFVLEKLPFRRWLPEAEETDRKEERPGRLQGESSNGKRTERSGLAAYRVSVQTL